MGRLVLVHTAPTAVEGQLLHAILEEEGIPALLKGEADGPYRLGPMYLWVDEGHEVQARLVIAEVESGSMALPEDDPED